MTERDTLATLHSDDPMPAARRGGAVGDMDPARRQWHADVFILIDNLLHSLLVSDHLFSHNIAFTSQNHLSRHKKLSYKCIIRVLIQIHHT